MKIVVKSLGGKGSKLHVGIEESVSSLKAKASKKLGCCFTFTFCPPHYMDSIWTTRNSIGFTD